MMISGCLVGVDKMECDSDRMKVLFQGKECGSKKRAKCEKSICGG